MFEFVIDILISIYPNARDSIKNKLKEEECNETISNLIKEHTGIDDISHILKWLSNQRLRIRYLILYKLLGQEVLAQKNLLVQSLEKEIQVSQDNSQALVDQIINTISDFFYAGMSDSDKLNMDLMNLNRKDLLSDIKQLLNEREASLYRSFREGEKKAWDEKYLKITDMYLEQWNEQSVEWLESTDDDKKIYVKDIYQELGLVDKKSKAHEYVRNHIEKSNKQNGNCLAILGEPGHGKTCLMKFLATDLSKTYYDKHIIMLLFRDFFRGINIQDTNLSIVDSIKRQWDLDSADNNFINGSVILLDGLDELAIIKGYNESDIKDFIINLNQFGTDYSCHIIVTSRQGMKDVFGSNWTICRLDKMSPEEQELYYTKLSNANVKLNLNKEVFQKCLKERDNPTYSAIQELLGIPLLFNMVVSNLKSIDNINNKTDLYKKFIEKSIDRFSERMTDSNSKDIDEQKSNFKKLLIAAGFWTHSRGKDYLDNSTIESLRKNELLPDIFNMSLPMNKTIMLLFHADLVESDSKEMGIVFSHLSFLEYLTARGILEYIQQADDNIPLWLHRSFRHPLSDNAQDFLVQQLNDIDDKNRQRIRKKLEEVLVEMVAKEFVVSDKVLDISPAKYPVTKACYTAYGFSLLYMYTTKNDEEYKEFPIQILPMYKFFLRQNKSFIVRLSDVCLPEADLKGARLEGANLVGANLVGANLEGAHLERAHLERAHLERAHLERTHLEGAHLEGAHLEGAHLEWANLKWAHLVGAHLEDAHLEGANLERAHLEGAHLVEAHLGGTQLRGAYLERAHLERAHLEWAHLEGAYLEGKYQKKKAILKWAKQQGAILAPIDKNKTMK